VEEDAHEGELEYSPGGQDAAAQRQLWTAHSHPISEYESNDPIKAITIFKYKSSVPDPPI
jgi:hypothetical protein